MTEPKHYNLLITSYLEPEHIERIRAVDKRLNVIYRPELLPTPRYAADHTGNIRNLTPEQNAEWLDLLGRADILFDFDYTHRADLPDLAPNVRWIQATSAGIGQFVKRNHYDQRMPETVFTTASGVHARPLAEFCIMSMMIHNKGLKRMIKDQQNHHWGRYAGTDLDGRTLALVGLGRIGSEVARLSRGLGMRVIGTDLRPNPDAVDRYYDLKNLNAMLAEADVVILTVPHTPETEKMIGAEQFKSMRKGVYFINISRGQVVDEPALIEALKSGHLSGAALDVFFEEPLPADNPLWDMENVLVSPHSASTSDRENERITDLFCDNLRRYLNNEPLRNVLNPELYF
jgi:phosphoglycerate dehydrogenase-like enzyme